MNDGPVKQAASLSPVWNNSTVNGPRTSVRTGCHVLGLAPPGGVRIEASRLWQLVAVAADGVVEAEVDVGVALQPA
jgi:hypothetical protein